MSGKMKQNIFHFILWFIVAVVLVIVFSTEGTIAQWSDNRTKTVLVAALFLFGFSGDAVLRIIFSKKRVPTDERDKYIQNKALAAGYVITLIYIFILAISIYTKYENNGMVPVAWIWFIAYSLVIIANLSVSAASVYQYWKSDLNG